MRLNEKFINEITKRVEFRLLYEEAKGIALEEIRIQAKKSNMFRADRAAAKIAKQEKYENNQGINRNGFVPLERRQCYKCGKRRQPMLRISLESY